MTGPDGSRPAGTVVSVGEAEVVRYRKAEDGEDEVSAALGDAVQLQLLQQLGGLRRCRRLLE
ncbi:MAG: hypothetical protein QOE92_1690, partial [Chloroflexota bacterium]|nr:hypothetical protein [Chloroflexota bacterium]